MFAMKFCIILHSAASPIVVVGDNFSLVLPFLGGGLVVGYW